MPEVQTAMRFARKSAMPTKEVLAQTDAARDRVFAEIDRLGLWGVIGEIDAKGYGVIRPELTAGFAQRAADALLATSERLTGVRPDLAGGSTHSDYATRPATWRSSSPCCSTIRYSSMP